MDKAMSFNNTLGQHEQPVFFNDTFYDSEFVDRKTGQWLSKDNWFLAFVGPGDFMSFGLIKELVNLTTMGAPFTTGVINCHQFELIKDSFQVVTYPQLFYVQDGKVTPFFGVFNIQGYLNFTKNASH